MKKFISALTSVCIAATSLVGATMTTVTAAGELEFTFKERSTSSTTFNISAADLAAGDVTVDCDMIITNYVPTYGFGLKMDFENTDTNTIYDASTAENPYFAFTDKTQFDKTGPFTDVWSVEDGTYAPQPDLSATKIANYSMMNFVWRTAATLDDDSTPTNAYFIPDTTNPLLNISFTVASDTPAGTYILDIKTEPYINSTGGAVSTGQSKINNVDGEVVPFKTVPLTIVVGDAATTTKAPAATTTAAPATTMASATSTTKSAPVGKGIVYEIGTVEGEAGADVDVPITIKGTDTGTAGMALELSADSNLKLKRRLNGNAYEGAPTWNAATLTYIWYSGDGRNLVAKDGAVLTTLKFTVPADAQPGDEYPVTFRSDLCKVIDQEGVELNITYVDGKIVIPGTATTTKAPTTTTSEAPATTTSTQTTTTAPVGTVLYGDTNVDGRVSIADAVLLNKYLAGKAEMTEQGKINADCDKRSTALNLDDTTMILKFLAQLIKQSDLGAEVD